MGAYSNSLRGPFVFDDAGDIVGNKSIRHLWQPRDIFLTDSAAKVGLHNRPVVNLTFAINYAMGGLNTTPYHVTNLIFHLLATVTLFGIVHRTLALPGIPEPLSRKALPLGLATALLWGLHPLQTQAVTYLTQRYESLMGLFYLAALYGLIRAGTSKSGRAWAGACVAAAMLAMGSKEVAVSVPIILMLYDRAFLAGSIRKAWALRRGLYLGLLGAWLGFALLQFLSVSRSGWSGYGGPYSLQDYAMSQFGVILHYMRLSLWPRPLVLDYGWPVARGAGEILPAAMVVGGAAAASVYALVRWPKLGFPGAWFFLILAPTSSILPIADLAFLHRMYLPLASIALLTVLGGAAAADAVERRGWLGARGTAAAATSVLAAAAVALAVGTWRRNWDYRSDVAIWEDTVAKAPGNARAQYNLGLAYASLGKPENAAEHLKETIRLKPDFAQAHHNLGVALVERGLVEEAVARFRKALELKPDLAEAHSDLGRVLVDRGRVDEGFSHLRKALEIKPGFAQAYNNLGAALAGRGRVDEAVAPFRKALEIKPDFAQAHYNLGNALVNRGRVDEGLSHLRKALEIKPGFAEAYNTLGRALAIRGRVDEGVGHFRKALEIKPDFAQAHNNLGVALSGRGHFDEAVAHFRKALEITSDNVEARANLGVALESLGRVDDAVSQYRQALALALQQGKQPLAEDMRSRLAAYETKERAQR